jgi:lysophospholipase L1-like esterase
MVLVLLMCVILGMIAESAVRVRQWMKYGFVWGVESTYTIDAESGLRVPIADSTIGSIEINSHGFRSPEIPLVKSKDRVRLAFLGASTTYCAEVSGNLYTWPHRVSEDLSRVFADHGIDYINAGVPGYAVATSIRNYEQRVEMFAPDVVLVYHATNDLSVNTFELAKAQGLTESRTEESFSWISEYSLLAYLLEKNMRIFLQATDARDAGGRLQFVDEDLADPFRRDLTRLVRGIQASGKLVVLITFSQQLRATQTPEQQSRAARTSLYYMPYMSIDGLLRAFDLYNEVIREVAADTGAVLVEAADRVPGDEVHFVDSAHLSDRGAAVFAEVVADQLLRDDRFAQFMEETAVPMARR